MTMSSILACLCLKKVGVTLLKELFKKTKYITVSPKVMEESQSSGQIKPSIPDGMWTKCEKCGQIIYNKDLIENNKVCTYCNKHFRMSAKERIELIIDKGTFNEFDNNMVSVNPLSFEGYEDKLNTMRNKLEINEAVITGEGEINSNSCVIAVMDSNFMMGSMGSVVGEKITRAIEKATELKKPLIIFTTSGGARMQEGMFSLMQMAKTSGALAKHKEAGLLYVAVLTDPTTGGVTASFAMLGDIIIGEQGALIGFAGKRVIEQTIKQSLPQGFQSAEFLMQHGFLDMVVSRKSLKTTLSKILNMHRKNWLLESKIISNLISRSEDKKTTLTAWEKLNIARKVERPTTLDYIRKIFESFVELHGDRLYGDDEAIVGGIAMLNGIPVTVIGHQKGKNTEENIKRNFGMPNPEGYRKALRLMEQAEKFKRPVICFIDTPGAFCGVGAEERGQGEAIAKNLMAMSNLKTPIISIVIGEGGSGGALALAVADEVWMLEHSIYSILSPEGFASILWKDSSKIKEAASAMKITAQDLKQFGIVDDIIEEPKEGAHKDIDFVANKIKQKLLMTIGDKKNQSVKDMLTKRYDKYRNMGQFIEI